ncbi:MAG: SpoIIE family protein phosphatase [Spirochaetaceae bacterium]|nr:SpoIIE family protein phosphatase [Spirochaetaceae bacterium]
MFRKTEKYYLWFALLNICIGLMNFGYHGISLYVLDRYWVYSVLTFLAAINTYYMILNFIHSFLGRKKGIIGKILTGYYLLSSFALIIEYVITGHIVFFIKYQYAFFNMSYIFLLIYLVVLNVKAIKAKTDYAKLFSIGVSILIFSFLFNMILFTGVFYRIAGYNMLPLIGESFFAMIITFSIILAKRYSKTYIDLEISNDENIELNNTLEEKVKTRTEELNTANLQLSDKNTQIMDSITYASTIQQSILPQKEVLTKNIKEHFTLWRPKNVVGGDFHWFHETKEGFLLAVCDCTGHGVPGALMTMTTYSVLNRIASHFIDDNPALILKELNKVLRSLLNQNTEKSLSDDGLDMGLCYYSKEDKRVIFSGAKNSLRIVQNGKLTELKGNKQSIGYFKSKEKFEYTNHEISIEENQTFYMTTDGFLDQNGGEKDFSFGKTRFNKMVLKYADLPLPEQKAHFEKELKEYMKDESQRDDIVVLGFKV